MLCRQADKLVANNNDSADDFLSLNARNSCIIAA